MPQSVIRGCGGTSSKQPCRHATESGRRGWGRGRVEQLRADADGGLAQQIRILADLPAPGPALLYRDPHGSCWVTENGVTGSTANIYVISRDQLGELMTEERVTPNDLEDGDTLARLVVSVVEWTQRTR